MPQSIIVRGEGMTLDLLLWRRFGVRGEGMLEETLSLNQGLADKGLVLPLGTEIMLPDLPPVTVTTAPVVTLFG